MEYENVLGFRNCYGCSKSMVGEDALNPFLVLAETSRSAIKNREQYYTHRNNGCLVKAKERIRIRLGESGERILERIITKT